MDEAKPFPIDCETIQKGQVFTAHAMAAILNAKPNTAAYRVKLVDFSHKLTKRLWAIDKPFTVVVLSQRLEVLTDEAAADYNAGFFERSRKRMFKAHRQATRVDTSGFTQDRKTTHVRSLIVQGAAIQGMSNGRREVQARAYKRLSQPIG